jgi:NADP-dependent 3-hydroxy acid dehydrogenase YdfG
VARLAGEIEAGAEAIRATGGEGVAARLDISDLGAVEAFIAGRAAFDVLVNNAGTNRPKPFYDVNEDDYDAVLGLNIKNLFFVTQRVVVRVVAEGLRGNLIHIGSQVGKSAGRCGHSAAPRKGRSMA